MNLVTDERGSIDLRVLCMSPHYLATLDTGRGWTDIVIPQIHDLLLALACYLHNLNCFIGFAYTTDTNEIGHSVFMSLLKD